MPKENFGMTKLCMIVGAAAGAALLATSGGGLACGLLLAGGVGAKRLKDSVSMTSNEHFYVDGQRVYQEDYPYGDGVHNVRETFMSCGDGPPLRLRSAHNPEEPCSPAHPLPTGPDDLQVLSWTKRGDLKKPQDIHRTESFYTVTVAQRANGDVDGFDCLDFKVQGKPHLGTVLGENSGVSPELQCEKHRRAREGARER